MNLTQKEGDVSCANQENGKTVLKTVIRTPILGGSGQIPVSSIDEARALAARLSAGTARLEVEAAAD